MPFHHKHRLPVAENRSGPNMPDPIRYPTVARPAFPCARDVRQRLEQAGGHMRILDNSTKRKWDLHPEQHQATFRTMPEAGRNTRCHPPRYYPVTSTSHRCRVAHRTCLIPCCSQVQARGYQHLVDDVDHTVGRVDVRLDDGGVLDHDRTVADGHSQVLT